MIGSILDSPMGDGKVSFVSSTTRSASATCRAIERIVTLKYRRGASFNRQHPFVDVLLSDITESGEVLDVSVVA